ncbi:glycosyltransferase [Dermatophilus congolensis]|uniref:D-inositol 3-phosphate glycosyltransferase n=1 Tax=Dermatophilus congolensis TaxID=1863 RepID=A0A239V7P8_9MICO|nr:glycosyltransferase [Dermatophilus congolensis]MBO3130448.1 glycosyltransferase [Dermatophilus congolensis]MBO3134920.1 glycosyltransferase [Dermatophilus congolensis]MBO3137159.1 glycosyltransferase [Dermatophilus congolensis]MBO3139402.1 glycosyltransferase [Dermatophilus congolensis]MBO3141642.1 glycosyltransferase [Dermatophilus congolensis]
MTDTHPHHQLRVHHYNGTGRLVTQSGLGAAMRHQRHMLHHPGIRLVRLNEHPDVLVLNTVFPDSVIVGRWARKQGIRVIQFAHSTQQDFENSWAGANHIAPLFGRWLGHVYAGGDAIITPTPYAKKLLTRYQLDAPIYPLTNGVDIDFFHGKPAAGKQFRERHNIAPHTPLVVAVGHLMVRKGFTDWIDLARRIPQAQFYWFGHTPRATMSKAVKRAIDTAPPNVHLPGYVPAAEVRDAYAAANLFCFASHEETEGIVVLEALASGTPTLVRDIPVYDSWLPENEIVHKARNLEEFEHKARAILAGEAPDLTQAARHRMQEYSLDRVAQRFLAICAGTAPNPDTPSTRRR